MKTDYIFWLNQNDALPTLVGAKAANLARLTQAGLPVPAAFCVATEAHRHFLRESRWPPDLNIAVLEAYRLLRQQHGNVQVAVRSSATAEDLPDASFAGQYASFLNVSSESELLDAIEQCWQSAASAQVQAYQSRQGQEGTSHLMAVIVQVMVQAECAGVLFTVDPVSNDRAHLAIEMTPGLGEGIVAGKTMPIRMTLDRRTRKTQTGAGSLPAVLAGIEWDRLGALALQIEELFNAPQDIEWAYANGQFWILQSRPITAHTQPVRRQIWTRANAGEILPGVVTPLTWSVFKPVLQAAGLYRSWSPLTIHWRWRHPSGQWPDSPRLIQGHAYLELTSSYAGLGNLPGVGTDVLQRLLGFEFHLCHADELPHKLPRWHVMDPYRATRFWLDMLGLTNTLPAQAEHWLRRSVPVPIVSHAAHVLLRQVDGLMKEASQILALHIQCTSMAFSAFGLLARLIRQCAPPQDAQTFEAGLIADFESITTVQQSIAIWELAQAAQHIPTLYDALMSHLPAAQVLEACQQSPASSEFVRRWGSFMERFGDRGTQEFELAVAHWREDPTFVIQTMRDVLHHHLPDPRERLARRLEASHEQVRQMRELVRRNGSFSDVWLFDRLLAAYRRYVPLRENLKYSVISRFNALRRMFVAVGKLLERQNATAESNDVFYLRHDEICQWFQSGMTASALHALVEQRKRELDSYAQSPAPDLWVTVNGRDKPMELPQWRKATILQGVGCSPGLVSGPAFVLTSVQNPTSAVPGHILIAASIDPGLTPLFLTAAGVVTEIGGALSHGATVAREYGLPAIVGVPHATRLVRTGQMITIDGFTGCVYLETAKEGEAAHAPR